MSFEALGVIPPILQALQEIQYKEPTTIQEKAIPLILQGKDILGSAQTGTGKTAAFAIPIIQQVYESKKQGRKRNMSALILTPTRELAIQIDENIKEYSLHTDVKHAVIYGGVKQGKQVEKLRKGIDLLVATPGRLLDLHQQGFVDFRFIEFFVLDEADRMLDMGFVHDIKKLLKLLPKKRQSLFFSATMPDNILALSQEILRSPVKIEVNPVSSSADTIEQYVYYTNRQSKKNLLYHILENPEIDQVLLFARTKHGADRITRDLKKRKIEASAIHGNKGQNQRQKALSDFKDGKTRVLVATDIAARGIDIDKLKYVINYDIPDVAETFVHRIGRSGRAGESGIAIAMSEPEENVHIKAIEKLTSKRMKVMGEHPFPQTDKPMTNQEKKEWNKEKQKRKQEFFKSRKRK